jgi:enediyne polyketide synthase
VNAKPIALVGLACRYPGANTPRELFENVLAGRKSFRAVPPERWRMEDYHHPDREHPDTTYLRQMAVLEDFTFDPSKFKIPQRTYVSMDQAHWLALQTADLALRDAALEELPTDRTAVILGNTLAGETSRAQLVRFRWPYARRVFVELLDSLGLEAAREDLLAKVEERFKAPFPEITEDTLAGGLANTIAGRICNHFDFRGGGYTVDGACSSSLLAVADAAAGLTMGEFDVALAGGVDISLDPFELVGFAKVGALSEGLARVYDRRAEGFLPGEGCGIVVLKRLEDAEAAGNRIYAVIRGWGRSSDGRGGLTAPSSEGQALSMRRAYEKAGYTLADVDLVEGHGTGTPVGDAVELKAVDMTLRHHQAPPEHRCGIGSIKSNIGHTKAAAGVAGLLKAVMALQHRILPPTQSLRLPHQVFLDSENLYPLRHGGAWNSDRPLRAGVSGAGFGGINAHVTLEAHPSTQVDDGEHSRMLRLLDSAQEGEILLLADRHPAGLLERLGPVLEAARSISHAQMLDLAIACSRDMRTGPSRLAVVADSPADLAEQLERARRILREGGNSREIAFADPDTGLYLRTRPAPPRIAFLYPGQGSQRLGMGYLLKQRYQEAAEVWQEADRCLADLVDGPLTGYVFRDLQSARPAQVAGWSSALTDTRIAQPAVLAAAMATTRVLEALGILPDVVVGHSLGEYGSLWSAGAMDTQTALRLVAQRGALMAGAGEDGGAMLSIDGSPEQVEALLRDVLEYAVVANYNGPSSTVVSGETRAIEQLQELCRHQEVRAIRLPVSNAFHSRLVEGAARQLKAPLSEAVLSPPRSPVISAVTGDFLEDGADLAQMLAAQITAPVRFDLAVQTCLDQGVDLLVEVGPGKVLSRLAARIGEDYGILTMATDPAPEDHDLRGFLHLAAYCFASGLAVRTNRLFEGRFHRPISLPYEPRFIVSPCENPAPPLEVQGLSVQGHAEVARSDGGVRHRRPPEPEPAEEVSIETPDAVFELLQGYVMSEFGYPRDMVPQDARMGEDLNLDSIKSVEVVSRIMRRMDLSGDPTGLTTLPLGELAHRLHGMTNGGGNGRPRHGQRDETVERDRSWVRVFRQRLVEEERSPAEHPPVRGPVLLVARETTPFVQALREALEERHGEVHLSDGSSPSRLEAPPVGCVVVAPEEPADLGEDVEERLYRPFRRLWFGTRSLLGSSPASRRGTFLALISRSRGLASAASPEGGEALAGASFVKSVALETPGLETRVVECDPDLPVGKAVEGVLAELSHGSGHVEAVLLAHGERLEPRVEPLPLGEMDEHGEKPSEGVVLVVGGAKGITLRLTEELGRWCGLPLALVGRSPVPAEGADDEVARGLAHLREAGLEARYFSCDVGDPDAVLALLAEVEAAMGPVQGVLHGAGLNRPHAVTAGKLEDFEAVIRPKAEGLANLLNALGDRDPAFFAVVSSVIGVSGMAGNADYAFANEWVNLRLNHLRRERPGTRWLAFAYSVWSEIGMGERLGSVEGLRRWGIQPVSPELGARYFRDLLERKWPRAVLIVASRMSGLPTVRMVQRPMESPFAATVLVHQPGVELISEVELHPERDRFLAEHDYQGSMLFPAVIGMEAMAQAARACIGSWEGGGGPPTLENMVFERPVAVPPEGRRIRIYALAQEAPAGVRRVLASIRSEVTDFAHDHFQAEVVWPGSSLPRDVQNGSWPEPLPLSPVESLYGRILFQGRMFQNILSYHALSGVHCTASIRVPEDGSGFEGISRHELVLDSPLARDAFLHSIQLCVPRYRILPISMERLVVAGFPAGPLYLVANERERIDREYTYDLEIRDAQGRVVEQMVGLRCRAVDDYEDTEVLEKIFQVHALAQGPTPSWSGLTPMEERR